jgi:hypothetical protein
MHVLAPFTMKRDLFKHIYVVPNIKNVSWSDAGEKTAKPCQAQGV